VVVRSEKASLGSKGATAAPHVQTALAGLGIVANYREGIGGRDVPTRRDVRGAAMRRDREHQLDLADIGGETGAATHGASIAGRGCGRQAAGLRVVFFCPTRGLRPKHTDELCSRLLPRTQRAMVRGA
jgi:hypothetical protein